METESPEIEARRLKALEAIEKDFANGGDSGTGLFVEHHLSELDGGYWQEFAGTDQPEPAQVLGLLVLQSVWSSEEDEHLDTFDFSLPGDVTNYVVSVRFDEDGAIDEIVMES